MDANDGAFAINPEFDTLCLSSGGTMGISMLGALEMLYRTNLLNYSSIKRIIGSSVGALLCFLLAIGYLPIELVDVGLSLDIFQTLQSVPLERLKEYGMGDHNIYLKPIQKLLYAKIGKHDITFGELYKLTGKHFVCVATCVKNNIKQTAATYFDYLSTPNFSCITALKMSCSIPLLFTAVEYNNSKYVDGGISDPFPILHFDHSNNKTLGICVYPESITTKFASYIFQLMYIPIYEIDRLSRSRASSNVHIIDLCVKGLSIVSSGSNTSLRAQCFLEALQTTNKIIKENSWIISHNKYLYDTSYSTILESMKDKNQHPVSKSYVTISSDDPTKVIVHLSETSTVLLPLILDSHTKNM